MLVGLVINGWGAFAVCVYCYARGYVSIVEMTIFAFTGVFIAEQVSFYVGRRFGPHILESFDLFATRVEQLRKQKYLNSLLFWLPEKSRDRSLESASNAVIHWGGCALIVGRWSPVAAMVPAVCAMLSMPYLRFTGFSLVSCILWVVGWSIIVYGTVSGYSAVTGFF